MRASATLVLASVLMAVAGGDAEAAERPMMRPRVPAEQLAEARALLNPLPASPETVEKGKTLYHGKGTCVSCHGAEGGGNGPAAVGLNPAPRNFRHRGFWRHRTDGELFWIIKHRSPGTGMVGFSGLLSDDEMWSLVHYERTFAGGRRGLGGMGRGGRSHRRPNAEAESDGRSPRSGRDGCEGERPRCRPSR